MAKNLRSVWREGEFGVNTEASVCGCARGGNEVVAPVLSPWGAQQHSTTKNAAKTGNTGLLRSTEPVKPSSAILLLPYCEGNETLELRDEVRRLESDAHCFYFTLLVSSLCSFVAIDLPYPTNFGFSGVPKLDEEKKKRYGIASEVAEPVSVFRVSSVVQSTLGRESHREIRT